MKKFLSVFCLFTLLSMTSFVMAAPNPQNVRHGHIGKQRIEHRVSPNRPHHHISHRHSGGSIAIGFGSIYGYPTLPYYAPGYYYDCPYYSPYCRSIQRCVYPRPRIHSGIYIGF